MTDEIKKHVWPDITPGDKAATALLGAYESIDRTRLRLWMEECVKSAPDGLHTDTAKDIVQSIVGLLRADLDVLGSIPDESSISRW